MFGIVANGDGRTGAGGGAGRLATLGLVSSGNASGSSRGGADADAAGFPACAGAVPLEAPFAAAAPAGAEPADADGTGVCGMGSLVTVAALPRGQLKSSARPVGAAIGSPLMSTRVASESAGSGRAAGRAPPRSSSEALPSAGGCSRGD